MLEAPRKASSIDDHCMVPHCWMVVSRAAFSAVPPPRWILAKSPWIETVWLPAVS